MWQIACGEDCKVQGTREVPHRQCLTLPGMTNMASMQDEGAATATVLHGASYSGLDSSAWVWRNSSPASRTTAASHTVLHAAKTPATRVRLEGGCR